MEANNADLRASHKRKRSVAAPSSFCLSCCFRKRNSTTKSISNNDDAVARENRQQQYHHDRPPPPRLTRTYSKWLKSRMSDFPEIRDQYRNIVSKLGRRTQCRRYASDFSYDAFSYALNFDDDLSRADEQFPPRCFSARLPPTDEAVTDPAADEEANVGVTSSPPQPIGEVTAFKFQIGD